MLVKNHHEILYRIEIRLAPTPLSFTNFILATLPYFNM